MTTNYQSNQRAQKDPHVTGEVGVAAGDEVLPGDAALLGRSVAAAEGVVATGVGDADPHGEAEEPLGVVVHQLENLKNPNKVC